VSILLAAPSPAHKQLGLSYPLHKTKWPSMPRSRTEIILYPWSCSSILPLRRLTFSARYLFSPLFPYRFDFFRSCQFTPECRVRVSWSLRRCCWCTFALVGSFDLLCRFQYLLQGLPVQNSRGGRQWSRQK
jgi:hypothetical protein